MQISTIGLDLAKNVFQAHGVSAEGKVVLKKQLRRGQAPGATAPRTRHPASPVDARWIGWIRALWSQPPAIVVSASRLRSFLAH